MTTGRFLAIVCGTIVCGSIWSSSAWSVEYLTGEKLQSTMTGLMLDFLPRKGPPIRHAFTDKGMFIEYELRADKNIRVSSVGKWWIEDDALVCVQDNRPNREKVCRRYAIEDDILKQYTASGVLTPDYMVATHK